MEVSDTMRSLRCPFTIGYTLTLTAVAVMRARDPQLSQRLVRDYSTNLANLQTRPVAALVGSAFVLDGGPQLNFPVFVPALAIAESRMGTRRTITIFALGHVGATAISAAVVRRGIASGRLDESLANEPDVGMSYGALAVRFAAIGSVNGYRATAIDAGRALAVLALTQPWHVARDFTALGHVTAAAIGALAGLVRKRIT